MTQKRKPQYWMVKQEPESYSWNDFESEGSTAWTGVRNFQARNNLQMMKAGDQVLFYHSGKDKEVVGVAEVIKAAYPDPTAKDGNWVAVDLKPTRKLSRPVALSAIRYNDSLGGITLVRQSQLSVMPLTKKEFDEIVRMSRQKRSKSN